MSNFTANDSPILRSPAEIMANGNRADLRAPLPRAARYALSLTMVAAAGVVAFVVDHLIASSSLSLVFVLPVVIAAASFGWGPAIAAAVGGMLVLDFFFLPPRFSFAIYSPADLWALALFVVIAAIVSTVAAESRRRALAAREAAEQAQALQALAHVVIHSPSRAEAERVAADALARIFKAPAAVLVGNGDALEPPTLSGRAVLSSADDEAARLAFTSQVATRAETYPVGAAVFDFWPINTGKGRVVLGVKFLDRQGGRPKEPERLVEMVGAYLALALKGPPAAAR